MMIADFFITFKSYFTEMFPALALGLLASGIIHEFIPDNWVERHLGGHGIKGIFYSTIVGAIVPVCCWGSLPIAVSLHKKGASLGPIFAILIATPATSVNALFVTARFFGLKFTAYIFFAVLVMGTIAGLIGNLLKVKVVSNKNIDGSHIGHETYDDCSMCCKKKTFLMRLKSVIKYACIDMPKEIGIETMAGLALAALVTTIPAIGMWIKSCLKRGYAYLFALIFGLVIYMCATMSVPLVHAFVNQGMNLGSGLSLLILGPIVSYGTVLVLRKEFGFKILVIFLVIVSGLSLLTGFLYTLL